MSTEARGATFVSKMDVVEIAADGTSTFLLVTTAFVVDNAVFIVSGDPDVVGTCCDLII